MKTLFLAGLLAVAAPAFAQLTPRNLLTTRYAPDAVRAALLPRASWQPFPNTPDAWAQALPGGARSDLIRAGEEAAQAGFPMLPATLALDFVRNGNRTRYERISFDRRSRLFALTLAEAVEGKGRFLDDVINGVWAVCEESFWGVPAHLGGQKTGSGLPNVEDRTVDLFAAETAALLALTDYFLGEKLAAQSPLIRPRIYHETNLRVFEPLSREPQRYGYLKKGTKVNNWNPWIMSNWLVATLFLEKDDTRRAAMTHAAMDGLDLYLNGLGEDGGCDEGPSYWFVAGASVFDALEILHSASGGRLSLYGEPLVRKMAAYVYKMHIAGPYFVNFADADPTVTADGAMLYRFGQRVNDETLTRFGQWAHQAFGVGENIRPTLRSSGFNRQRRVQNILALKDLDALPKTEFPGVRDAWFPDVQVLTARTPKGLFVATHGGHNAESHNHNDVGDFILYAGGQPVIIDAGRGIYTAMTFSSKRYDLWYTQSQYHNLPTVNGVLQNAGKQFAARTVKAETTPDVASLTMDLAPAYPAEAGIRAWQRTVRLDRKAEALDVTDEFSLNNAPTSLQQSFMTTSTVDLATPGLVRFSDASHPTVQLTYDAKRYTAAIETLPLDGPDDEGFKTKWVGKPIQRVLLTAVNPQASGKVRFRFAVQ